MGISRVPERWPRWPHPAGQIENFGSHFLALPTISGCQPELATRKGGCQSKLLLSKNIPKKMHKHSMQFRCRDGKPNIR